MSHWFGLWTIGGIEMLAPAIACLVHPTAPSRCHRSDSGRPDGSLRDVTARKFALIASCMRAILIAGEAGLDKE
ncbi:MAG: hypothetical protein C0476_12030 [Sphingomonas sp.]|nr:hypothetical protein [Sphingomonas sp.]